MEGGEATQECPGTHWWKRAEEERQGANKKAPKENDGGRNDDPPEPDRTGAHGSAAYVSEEKRPQGRG